MFTLEAIHSESYAPRIQQIRLPPASPRLYQAVNSSSSSPPARSELLPTDPSTTASSSRPSFRLPAAEHQASGLEQIASAAARWFVSPGRPSSALASGRAPHQQIELSSSKSAKVAARHQGLHFAAVIWIFISVSSVIWILEVGVLLLQSILQYILVVNNTAIYTWQTNYAWTTPNKF